MTQPKDREPSVEDQAHEIVRRHLSPILKEQILQAIDRAQEQARREAIEECLEILECDKLCTDMPHRRIRALLKEEK